jgi:hypothetical protein
MYVKAFTLELLLNWYPLDAIRPPRHVREMASRSPRVHLLSIGRPPSDANIAIALGTQMPGNALCGVLGRCQLRQIAFGFLEKIAVGRVAIAHHGPREWSVVGRSEWPGRPTAARAMTGQLTPGLELAVPARLLAIICRNTALSAGALILSP